MSDKPTKGEKLHEGKAKIIYHTDDPGMLIQYFKDDATAFNGQKKGTIDGKGISNCAISTHIYKLLEEQIKFPTHLVEQISQREQLIKKVEIIPVEVVLRNVVAGSLAKRMGIDEGPHLSETILEYYYKDDDLGDPMINRYHIKSFNLATDEEMDHIEKIVFTINDWLIAFFDRLDILLVDYKLEFGRHESGILLADEISPDGCRLWDKNTGEKMDKDRFRRDLGKLEEVYTEMRERITSTF